VDGTPATRPGVPRERRVAREAGVHREVPPRQLAGREALARSGVRHPTTVFGTAQPPRGLSGLLRRAAYRLPDHRASRWALLLGADRVDVLEHRLARAWLVLPALGALALGFAMVRRALAAR
jgi:hypothetical protein